MSEIKTAEQRIHKLEGGEGDSFVTFEQALIAERDELRAALADRDARLAALEGAYIPTYLERLAASPATLEVEFTALRSEALDLRAALAERDAALADALRYRYLRDDCLRARWQDTAFVNAPSKWLPEHQTTTAEDDAAIDAAIRESNHERD